MEKVSQRKLTSRVKRKNSGEYHKVESILFNDSNMILKVDNSEYTFKLKNISQKLLNATSKEREAYKVICSGYGISWPLIDEDLSIDGLLKSYIK